MSDFWSRKKEELREQGVIPKPVVRSDGPWWAQNTNLIPQQRQPVEQAQPRTQPTSGGCPTCGSGNYTRPTSNSAARCFECGYVQGRQLNEPNIPSGLLNTGAQTLKVRQLPSQGHFGRSVAEINENAQILEQSAQGRAKLG